MKTGILKVSWQKLDGIAKLFCLLVAGLVALAVIGSLGGCASVQTQIADVPRVPSHLLAPSREPQCKRIGTTASVRQLEEASICWYKNYTHQRNMRFGLVDAVKRREMAIRKAKKAQGGL